LLYIKDKVAYYYENYKDHFRVGLYCLGIFLKDKAKFKAYLKFWHSEFKKLDKLFVKVRQTDLTNLDLNKLNNLLEEIYLKAIKWHGIAYNVDAIDATLNPLVEELIAKCYAGERKTKLSEIYNKLTFPEVLSYANRMNYDKLKLMSEIKTKGLAQVKTKIKKFIEDYYWINFQWGESKEYDQAELISELGKTSESAINDEITRIEQNFKQSLAEKKKVIKEIAVKEPIIKDYIGIFDAYTLLHDYRKEGQVKAVYYIRNIYKEIALRLKVDYQLLYYYWPNELIAALKLGKNLDIDLLKKRGQEWLCEYYANGKMIEEFGAKAGQTRDKAIGLVIDETNRELLGVSASLGRITGPAKVCLSAKIANEKIQEGDILVTGMTMPEFVTAMKKAAAVVTDEGGLTCHAAIICRELGKPCVVGTKLATRIIKDGDQIEVNANHGVVKIIKKAE